MAEDEPTHEATMPQPVTTAAPAAASPQPSAASAAPSDAAAASAASAALVEEVRRRVARANYGVSAKLSIALLDRGDHGLLLFEADEHQEALRAASAALATTPDDDTRNWRFVGSGPDLETGRYRAVVRVDGPMPSAAAPSTAAGAAAIARVAPE